MNDALKEEIQHLKVLTGQGIANGGPMMNFPASFGGNQQFYSNNQAMHTLLAAQQLQQLQLHSHKQQHQFQQHQLHQFQQQQLQHQQPLMQQDQLSQAGDVMPRGSLSSPQNDNASDVSSVAKD